MKIDQLKKDLEWIGGIFKMLKHLDDNDCTIDELMVHFLWRRSTLRQYLREWRHSGLVVKRYNNSTKIVHFKIPYIVRGTKELKIYLQEIRDLIDKYLSNTL